MAVEENKNVSDQRIKERNHSKRMHSSELTEEKKAVASLNSIIGPNAIHALQPSSRLSNRVRTPTKNDLGFERPKLRATSPNTSHLTHIKPKNVVKKFAFATRIGFEPDLAEGEKVNEDAFILAPNI